MNVFDDYFSNGSKQSTYDDFYVANTQQTISGYDWFYAQENSQSNSLYPSYLNILNDNNSGIPSIKWNNDIIKFICQEDNIYKSNERLSGLSIIIAAYNTEQYIEQTLNSIQTQKWCMEHDNYEILIGIDGCEKTLNKVRQIMVNYHNVYVYNMSSNMGTFVTANTLIQISKYDKIMRFDSDDFFIDQNSLCKIMEHADEYDMIRYKFTDYYNSDKKLTQWACSLGSILFKASLLDLADGYVDWKCSGDREFYERVKNNITEYDIDEPIYYHRIRTDGLMQSAETCMTSDYRHTLKEIVDKYDYKKGDDIHIEIVTNTYECVMPEESFIVSMTSWPKRISSVVTVVNSILSNTIQPYKIVLNLSIAEFPNKTLDLPKELCDMIQNNKIIVNWLINNAYVWKKSIPTIIKYPESYVICIDDDFIYPNDFIQIFQNAHEQYPNKPLTGATTHNQGTMQHCGCGSMDSLKWLDPYLHYINKDIYDTGDEDTFLTVCYYLNNIIMETTKIMGTLKSMSLPNGYSATYNIKPGRNFNLIKRHMNIPSVEFVTVNYNTPDYLAKLLLSFYKYSNGLYHFRIIDGSDNEEYKNQSLDIAKKLNTEIDQLGYNIHHGPGMDYAINNSKYDYVFIVDSDLEFTYNIPEIVNKMIEMKKAISGFNEYVDENGVNVNHEYISYIHPRFMLVNVNEYKKLSSEHNVKYVKHGAPCINVMKYIHDNKLESQMLGKLPEADKNLFYKADKRGTWKRFGLNI